MNQNRTKNIVQIKYVFIGGFSLEAAILHVVQVLQKKIFIQYVYIEVGIYHAGLFWWKRNLNKFFEYHKYISFPVWEML